MRIDTITILTASEGHYLTDGECYGKKIYLAIDRSPDEFHEITDEEYGAIKAREAAEQDETAPSQF